MNDACFYRVSVKGVVFDEAGRILLTRENNGKWELLGGGLEHGEDPIEGLRREIQEEAGLTVTKISASPRYFLTAPRLNKPTLVANVIYEIELENLDFVPSDECLDLRFFSLDEMRKLDVFPNVSEFISVLTREAALAPA